MTDEEFIDEQRKYEEKYRKELKHYGMLSKPEDSKKLVLQLKQFFLRHIMFEIKYKS